MRSILLGTLLLSGCTVLTPPDHAVRITCVDSAEVSGDLSYAPLGGKTGRADGRARQVSIFGEPSQDTIDKVVDAGCPEQIPEEPMARMQP